MKKNTENNVLKLIGIEKDYSEKMYQHCLNMSNEKAAKYHLGKAAAFSEVMELFNSNVYFNDVLEIFKDYIK